MSVAQRVFRFFILALIATSALEAGPTKAQGSAASVVEGETRFQVLAPNLVRMEYSPGGKFIDEPSVSVLKRDWPKVSFQASHANGWLEIKTDRMIVRYRSGTGPFTAQNLQMIWKDGDGEHTWKPGDKDDRNLGGVPGDIATRAVPGNETGPLSRNGYYLLDDSRSAIWDKAGDWVKPRPEPNSQDLYFFVYGRDFKGMLGELAQLLGPIPMVPRYVLGTWFGSRAGYSAGQWKMIAQRFREESIPLDMMVIDSISACKVVWSGYNWDYEQMPDPKEFISWMLKHGIHLTLNEHYGPLTRENFDGFEAVRKLMDLPPETREIPHNLADKKYAQAYMDLMHKPALAMGLAFWWQDGNAGAKMAGLDPTLWTRHIEYEGSERITGKRAFVFCRLGEPPWPEFPGALPTPAWGVHRYGSYFTGDLIPYWSTLDLLIPFNVQAANMLVGYVNSLNAGVNEESVDPEIYQRWLQFSSFSPLFWWHGMWGLRLPWEYGPQGVETAHKFMELRYRLLPYLYTCSRTAHDTGVSPVRGMYVEYPQQEPAYSYLHQYMFGPNLLVAPISEPGYGKPVLKDIYLPDGEDWFDYFTGGIYKGGQVVNYQCPLDRMPLFVRAGSILPLAPDMSYSDQKPVDPLILDVYAGKAASFRLYEDDGTSLDYRQGAYAWTPLAYTPDLGGSHKIEIGPSRGRFKGQMTSRRYEVRVHGLLKPETVKAGSRELEEREAQDCGAGCEGWNWDSRSRTTTIRLAKPIGIGEKVTVSLERAGTYADALLLQRVLDYRERLRRVKIEEKLKHAILLNVDIISKPPRIIRETEAIESELDNLVANPRGIAQSPPDFRAMTARVLKAFLDQPFESQRTIPAPDLEVNEATRKIGHAVFEPWEIRGMTRDLLGCELLAKASGIPSPTLIAKLKYDTDAIGPAKIDYEIELPDKGLPGWIMTKRSAGPEGYAEFGMRAPFPPERGVSTIRVKATLTWEGGRTEVWRDVEWFSTGLPREPDLSRRKKD
jgi:alpha-glucosidase (family GH31 glycosyl hydrolase)